MTLYSVDDYVTVGDCSTVLTLNAGTTAEFIGVAECASAVDE